jgi:hypothetical protein
MNVLDNMNLPDVVVPLQQPQASLANNNAQVNAKVNSNVVSLQNVNVNLNDVKHDDSLATAEHPVFLLVASRDLDEEEHSLLNLYGKVLKYDNCHVNIPLDQLIKQNHANYVIFDVRDKNHRMAISKASVHHDNPHVHIIAVVSSWEKLDDFVDDAGCENCLSSLPPKQAFKKDFDTLLLEKKIRKPSCVKNILRLILKAWGGWGKD